MTDHKTLSVSTITSTDTLIQEFEFTVIDVYFYLYDTQATYVKA